MQPKPTSAPGSSARSFEEAIDENDPVEEAFDEYDDFPNDDLEPEKPADDDGDANGDTNGDATGDANGDAEGLEEFISESRIDDRAEEALRECPPDVQVAVMRRGSLNSARNPSSVLLARIRDATATFGSDGSAWVRMRGLPFETVKDEITRFWQEWLDRKNFKPLGPSAVALVKSPEGRPTGEAFVQFATEEIARDAIAQKNMDRIGGRYIELFVSSTAEVRRHGIPTIDDEDVDAPGEDDPEAERRVEEFIEKNHVDERAATALRGCSVNLQKQVIENGELTSARNPSSVVLARIRDAQKYGGSKASGPTEEEIEDFLKANGVDEAAEEAFKRCGVQLQRLVMEKGIISSARNPSSTLLSRIRDARDSLRQRSQSPQRDQRARLEEDLETFFRRCNIDDRAAEACRRAPHWVRESVLRNDFSQARNPSSALMAFVKEKERQTPEANPHKGEPPPRPPPPPADGAFGRGGPPFSGMAANPPGYGMGYGYGPPPGYAGPPPMHGDFRGDFRGQPMDHRAMGRTDPRGAPDRRPHPSDSRRFDEERERFERERFDRERYEADRRFGARPPERRGQSRDREHRGGAHGGGRYDAFSGRENDRGRRDDDRYGPPPGYGGAGRRLDGGHHNRSRSRDRPPPRPREGEYDRGDRRREGEWDRGHDFRGRRSRSREHDRKRAPYDPYRAPPHDAAPPRPGPGPGPAMHPPYFGADRYGPPPGAGHRDGYGGDRGGHRAGAGDPFSSAVEHLISQTGVDKDAAEAFRRCGPDVQSIVMERSSIGGARNPSAMLLSCIRDARNDLVARANGGRQGPSGDGGGGGGRGGPPRPSSRPGF